MGQILAGLTLDFVVLATGVVLYVIAAHWVGRWAMFPVFVIAWLGLLVNAGALSLLEYNSAFVILRHLALPATLAVAFTALAALWAERTRAFRKTLGYGFGGAAFSAYALPVIALLIAGTVPRHFPCTLPSLESSVPTETIAEVGTSGFFSNTCPVPVATEFELARPYGSIGMFWWGSPHRLYIVGEGQDGGSLTIRGARVEQYSANRQDSPLGRYTSRITFPVETYVPGATAEAFTIEVSRDGRPLEELDLKYVPQQCTCAVYDTL
jgi:hypothetical protein